MMLLYLIQIFNAYMIVIKQIYAISERKETHDNITKHQQYVHHA